MRDQDRSGAPSVSSLSDAMDRLRIEGAVPGILPLKTGWTISGPAFTVRYTSARQGSPGTVGDYVDAVPEGAVIVLDNEGRTDCTVWGGILTEVAARRKIQGTVISGVCRDVSTALRIEYPIFARGRFMRTGKDRVEVAAIGQVANLGSIRVEPGDIVVGDDDGVVVVPQSQWTPVVEAAREIEHTEDQIARAVAEGLDLAEARRRLGYHSLQRSREVT